MNTIFAGQFFFFHFYIYIGEWLSCCKIISDLLKIDKLIFHL